MSKPSEDRSTAPRGLNVKTGVRAGQQATTPPPDKTFGTQDGYIRG